jgi:hypothetical protein
VRERQNRSDREWVLERVLVLVRQSKKERPERQMLHKELGQDKKAEEHMLALVELVLSRKQSGVEQVGKMAEEQQERKTVQELERKMVEERKTAQELGHKMAEERKTAQELEHKMVEERKTAQELEHMMAEERKKAGEERKIAEKELGRKMVEERKTVGVESRLAEELGDRPVAAGKPK